MSVWCGIGHTVGLEMFNDQGVSVLQIGQKDKYDKFDFDLAERERIVGVSSRLYRADDKSHCNLTFIIGWLE